MANAKVNPFAPPERCKRKLRIVVDGPAGSGKSLLMLMTLRGLVGPEGRIAIIDSEREAIKKYAGVMPTAKQPEGFDCLSLTNFGVDDYCNAIDDAIAFGYDAIGIDSCSHEWIGTGGILQKVDQAGGDNAYFDKKGWRKMTPEHMRFIDKATGVPAHVFATIRSKVDYEIVTDTNGKKAPVKIGLAPIQREGFDYEFDIVGSMSLDHTLTVSKSRTLTADGDNFSNFLEGAVIPMPTIALGRQLREWCEAPEAEWVAPTFARTFTVGDKTITTAGISKDTYLTIGSLWAKVDKKHGAQTSRAILTKAGYSGVSVLTEAQGVELVAAFEEKLSQDAPPAADAKVA